MSDIGRLVKPPLNCVSTFHPDSLGSLLMLTDTVGPLDDATTAAFTANLAHYFPFRLWEPSIAVKMSYVVGATANASNVDLGIYDMQANRIVITGSTAQGSLSTNQEIDITDTLLLPGDYLMAMQGSSGGGGAFVMTAKVDENALPLLPLYSQAVGSFGLPATATFTLSTANSPLVYAMAVHFDTLV